MRAGTGVTDSVSLPWRRLVDDILKHRHCEGVELRGRHRLSGHGRLPHPVHKDSLARLERLKAGKRRITKEALENVEAAVEHFFLDILNAYQ